MIYVICISHIFILLKIYDGTHYLVGIEIWNSRSYNTECNNFITDALVYL